MKNTRDIDLNTPEVKRKKESVPSRDTESPVAGSAPGQEEVLSAPAVLRANYSGRTWSQMAVAKTPFCVRLLDMAKRRLDEPACKWKDTQGDWIAVSWSKLAQLVERIAKGLIAVGIKRGDRVLLLAETRHEWGAVCLATQMVGAVVVTAFSSASAEVSLFLICLFLFVFLNFVFVCVCFFFFSQEPCVCCSRATSCVVDHG